MEATDKCWCSKGDPIAFVDQVTQRGYCRTCAMDPILSSTNVNLQFLSTLLPYTVGERVECRTVGEYYDGNGEIIEISEELHNGGTPVHPAFLVKMDDGQTLWYTSICLTRLHERVR